MESKVRLDKYLWAIRIFKTRSLANEACEKGRIKMNGTPLKASKTVKIGEELHIKTPQKNWQITIIGIIDKRVAYSEAIKHYQDNSPIEEKERIQFMTPSFYTGKKLSKIGRPTKKNRRALEKNYLKPFAEEENHLTTT